ncbi:hypothetical protein HL653_20725 [Sphingomonas sp. AP4-R1]|uniref:hypothetical protein n=1 Tax=Sphingomonas sp. AP4-R1 TaxID=2735134 RepID=UPI00149389BE|nr:hypothetical protein [Sphingomonas sp. AP4-R1]QJU59844.1 hypothetical protein HL653_20725 [Sphingomonas sp. AP4-R1]
MAIMRQSALLLACATGLFASAAAIAGPYASRDIGGWTVAPSKDGSGCFVTRTFDRPGETTLLLGLDLDGKNHLSVLNTHWSIKPQDRLKLDFRLSNGGYTKHFAVGMVSEGKQGFVTSFETKFPTFFATSKILQIFRGDVPVERLALDGSGAAVVELRTCVEAQRDKPVKAGPDERASDDIPADPFAADPKRKLRSTKK